MKRVFHPYDKWEDYKHGFYGGLDYPKDNNLTRYADLLRNLEEFEKALKIIVSTWKYSCEHNLTNENINRIAYLGQAACALMYNTPNSASMGGYNLLSSGEQQKADALAEKYLNIWLEEYEHSQKV
jgi:hypothetical protein